MLSEVFHAGRELYLVLMEFDGEDLCFGYVIGHDAELGYFRISELLRVRGVFGLPVERDLYFEPCRLSQVKHSGY